MNLALNGRDKALIVFLSKAFGLYFFWYLLYERWLNPEGTLDQWVIDQLADSTNQLLQLLGYQLIPPNMGFQDIRVVGIDGTHGLWIGIPCNGITLFALFTGFIIAFPGPIRHKAWFIPVGLVAIHLFNLIRILSLCIVLKYFPDSLAFNHTYTFTIFVYSFVFLLWLIWVLKFATVQKNSPERV